MVAEEKGRKSPRAQVSLVARYRSPTAFDFVEEQCSDLSAGGMFIKSPAPAPAGTLLKLECEIDHGAQTVRGVARVVWLREIGSDSQPPGMGVKFVKLEAGGREAIQSVLAQHGDLKEPPDAVARRSQPGTPKRASLPSARTSSPARPNGMNAGASAKADMSSLDEPFAPPRSDPRELTRARAEANAAQTSKRAALSDGMSDDAPTVEMPMPDEVAAVIAKERSADVPAPPAAKAADTTQHAKKATAPARPSPPKLPKQAPIESPSGRPLVYIALAGAAALGLYWFSIERSSHREPSNEPSVKEAPEFASAAQPEPAPEAVKPVPEAPDPTPAAQAEPEAPAAAPKYVLEITTKPDGAHITANGQSMSSPGTIELGALDEPVQVVAEKKGFENASVVVDRVGFMLDEGQMRRRIVLVLPEKKAAVAPEPASVERNSEGAEPIAKADPKPTEKPRRKSTGATKSAVKVAASAGKAEPQQEASATPSAPAAKSAKQTPMEVASACLQNGDNACVVSALEGKAKSARELELLIETYRTLGDSAKADKQMQAYLTKYPSERRANSYRRMLENRKTENEPSAAQ